MTMNDEPRPPLVLALLAEKRAADLARRQAEERAAAETAARRADIAEHNSGYVSLWDVWCFIQKQYELNSSEAYKLLKNGLKGSGCKIYGKWITENDSQPPDYCVNPKDIRYAPLPNGPVLFANRTNEEDHRTYGYVTSPCPDDRFNTSDVVANLEMNADILAITKDDARRVFGFTEEVQQPAAELPAPVLHQSDVVARRRAEDAQAAADVAARRAAKAAHDAQFITVAQLVDRMRGGGVSRHASMIAFEVLRANETPLFCRWAAWKDWKDGRDERDWHPDDARWTPLPPCPVVCFSRADEGAGARWGQTYTHINSMGNITTPDPLLSALAAYGFDAELLPRMGSGNGGMFNADALAIRREDAARLFDLAEPASIAPDHPEDVREMVTAPSASPPAPADPVAHPAGAAARLSAAAQAPAAPGGVVRNSASRKRAGPLDAVFRRAKQEATDPTCPHSVWAALMALAAGKNPPPELTDFDDEKGIQATGVRGGWLSKGAFIERWRRGTV